MRIVTVVLALSFTGLGLAQDLAERCRALRELTDGSLTIIRATPADGNCRVETMVTPEVRIDVLLPGNWNGKFLMRGNGGYAGTMDRNGAEASMKQGWAVGVTDTGHDAHRQPLGTFAVERQKVYDYAFRSLHLTATVSKRIIRTFYGRGPEKSYYVGCSTGGRQGLMLAQRYPQDFDGIIAGAPVLDFTGTMFQYLSTARALAAGPLTLAKARVIEDAVLARCDANDGLKDGLITDPARCDFSPRRDLKLCAGVEAADCVTEAQVKTLETIYAPVRGVKGVLMEGWPVGGEAGWGDWILKDNGPTISFGFGESFMRYLAFPQPRPEQKFLDVNAAEADVAADWIRPLLDATDPDLSAFRKRGGKLILYFGLADPALNANMAFRYHAAVEQKLGGDVSDFFQFFTMPGVYHCGGGPGCGSVDYLPHLIDWVEKGKAPAGIVGAQRVNGKVVRTRPICAWPKVAVYKGSGDVNDASSFACGAHPQ